MCGRKFFIGGPMKYKKWDLAKFQKFYSINTKRWGVGLCPLGPPVPHPLNSTIAAAMMTSCCFSSSSKITNFYDNSCRKFRFESYRYAGKKKSGKPQPTEQVLIMMGRGSFINHVPRHLKGGVRQMSSLLYNRIGGRG